MKEETHDINEIIIRYLDGSAELEEKRLLLRWLKQSDDNRDDFIATRDLWLSCNVAAGNELEIDIALGKLKNRILLEQGRQLPGWLRWLSGNILYNMRFCLSGVHL